MATYIGPHAERIKELFGTPTVPTAFTAEACEGEVIAQVRASHPGVLVYAKPPELPKPRCAAAGCRRAAIAGKVYCFLHAKAMGRKFYRQWSSLKDRTR